MRTEVTDTTFNEMQSPRILFLPGLALFSLPMVTRANPFLFLLTAESISGNHVLFLFIILSILYTTIIIISQTTLLFWGQIHFGHDVLISCQIPLASMLMMIFHIYSYLMFFYRFLFL